MMVLVITMVSGMLLSRFRTLEEYGTYSQLLMVINLVTTVIMMGLPNSLNYFLARADENEEKSHFLSVYYSLSTILSFVVGLVLILITPILISYFDNPMIKDFWFFMAVFPWTKIIMSGVENLLVVYRKTNMIMIYRWSNSIALLAIILIVKLFSWTFITYMILYVAVEAAFALWVYLIAKKNADFLRFSLDFSLIKKIFAFSIPIGLASMVGTLNAELDKLAIGGLLDTESLAIYTNAGREMPVTIIASSVTAVLLPQMARFLKNKEVDKATKIWSNATLLSFTLITFFAAALIVFAPEVITFLYSEKYIAGVPIFIIYTLHLPLRSTYFGMVLNSSGKTKFILYSSIATLVLNVILNYALFFAIGFEGPAIATLISVFVMNFVQLIWTSRVLKVNFLQLFEWKKFGQSLAINVILALFGFALKVIIPIDKYIGSISEAIIIGIVWFAVFLVINLKTLKKIWYELKI